MAHYRLDCFSKGHVYRCEELEAEDDAAALREALQLRGLAAAQLWRRIHVFPDPTENSAGETEGAEN